MNWNALEAEVDREEVRTPGDNLLRLLVYAAIGIGRELSVLTTEITKEVQDGDRS